ncbi:hypothetical protein GIB67_011758 [Kingdonia uniflora]|uniref:Transposase n=1 Tax=Kingdonia uniflora TaxID=39325 RepID=A0A7J7NEP4_9MAGN|nr:hypothetical protein GIB67_011758 [Kingdonia uniflora]
MFEATILQGNDITHLVIDDNNKEVNHWTDVISKIDIKNVDAKDGYYNTHSSQDGDGVPTTEDIANTKIEKFVDPIVIGMEWLTINEARNCIRTWSIQNKFTYEQVKNKSYRLRFKCTDEKCKWLLYVRRSSDEHTMIVKKGSHLEHTCEGNIEDKNRLANALWVANYCGDGLRNIKLSRPIDVFTTIRRKFGIDLSYWTSWNAWTICMERIIGSYDEGYFKMPSLTIELLTTNPGSIIGCSRDDATLQWTGTMVMFKASYDSWLRGCRPILGLDGCFLKGKYGGVCLSIIGLDGNNGLFSVATYFCRSECYDTWNTFLKALQSWLDQHDAKLTFISDRQKGLIKAVTDNFHHCNHRFCFRHMYKNFKKIYKGTHLEKLFWNATRAYRTIDKNNFLAKLGEYHLSASHWLEREPPETWCRSHFDSTAKCEHITNNFSESFNNCILRVKDKPLHKSLEKLNMMMMTLIYCSEYHWVSTYMKAYASAVYLVADETSWVKPPRELRPPPLLRPTGKLRKSWRKDEDELTNSSARRCGKYGHYGHNKKTCKGPPAADKVVHNKKKLTRVDAPRSQEKIKVKFGFSTLGQGSEPRPSTTTSQTT